VSAGDLSAALVVLAALGALERRVAVVEARTTTPPPTTPPPQRLVGPLATMSLRQLVGGFHASA